MADMSTLVMMTMMMASLVMMGMVIMLELGHLLHAIPSMVPVQHDMLSLRPSMRKHVESSVGCGLIGRRS